jgi:uncharacterized membrane protein YdbT with pleckstrin-like domain
MGIPQSHLNDEEEIVLDLHPHWWFLTPRAALLIATMVLAGVALVIQPDESSDVEWYHSAAKWGAAALLLVVLLWFLARVVQWATTDFVVTNERCIFRTGVVAKRGIEIPLDRINTVFFNQGVFERMIGAGDIGIESAGENSRQDFSDIRRPSHVQKVIYREMENYESRRQDRLGAAVRGGQTQELSIPAQIAELDELRSRGVLSDEEFAAKKAELLERM